ncbi:hypothetical protein AMJ52_00865 [candidate division TA06 bacterium DG_78]|uniref:Uncharacterized protein n=1 Tax=candidate division TA06 bacterium DG_78 TaxID=1703772 RepID=A0A0S7YJC4_UNCT6|nr:MAG: hypothetical protein AMJ52_00865 [candidate division TA06 bacterium DG_78]
MAPDQKLREPQRVVAHFKDGRIIKGYTHDFIPPLKNFSIQSGERSDDIMEIRTTELKALFFVKSFEGNKQYVAKNTFDDAYMLDRQGLKVKVTFSDGEIMRGTTPDPGSIFRGFFVIPVDPKANNDKVYVEADSTVQIQIGSKAVT